MANGDVTFGLVVAPTPRGPAEEIAADPAGAARRLIEENERFIEAAAPHFSVVWVEDHFQWDDRPVVEAITTLSYLAGRHENMLFGHIVLGQSYRNPALVAKMAANLQVLTGGRYILGIGAGWKEDEYHAYGYPYPPARVRVEQLEEAAQITRLMWSESPATFHGKYYNIEEAQCQPQPNPPVPLLIGGGGEKQTLRVVATYADWWNYNFSTAEEYAHKQEVLAAHCRDVGRDPGEIIQTYYGLFDIVADPSKAARRDFHVVGGTADAVAAEINQFVKLGVSHIQMRFADFPETRGLEAFVEKVIPAINGR